MRQFDNELMHKDDWDEFWDHVDPKAYIRTLYLHDRLMLSYLASLIRRYKPKRFLELGCACSKNLYRLPGISGPGPVFFGLDPSLGALQASSALFDTKRVLLTGGDLFAAPYKPGSFDLVVSFGLIEHYRDPQPFLQSCIDLLEPGGLLIAGYPSYQGLTGYLQRRINPIALEHHFSLPSARMSAEFNKAGLIDINSSYFGLFNPNMISWGKGKLPKAMMYFCFAVTRPLEMLAGITGWQSMPGALASYVVASGVKPK